MVDMDDVLEPPSSELAGAPSSPHPMQALSNRITLARERVPRIGSSKVMP
jgi:hypothetical protein